MPPACTGVMVHEACFLIAWPTKEKRPQTGRTRVRCSCQNEVSWVGNELLYLGGDRDPLRMIQEETGGGRRGKEASEVTLSQHSGRPNNGCLSMWKWWCLPLRQPSTLAKHITKPGHLTSGRVVDRVQGYRECVARLLV